MAKFVIGYTYTYTFPSLGPTQTFSWTARALHRSMTDPSRFVLEMVHDTSGTKQPGYPLEENANHPGWKLLIERGKLYCYHSGEVVKALAGPNGNVYAGETVVAGMGHPVGYQSSSFFVDTAEAYEELIPTAICPSHEVHTKLDLVKKQDCTCPKEHNLFFYGHVPSCPMSQNQSWKKEM